METFLSLAKSFQKYLQDKSRWYQLNFDGRTGNIFTIADSEHRKDRCLRNFAQLDFPAAFLEGLVAGHLVVNHKSQNYWLVALDGQPRILATHKVW